MIRGLRFFLTYVILSTVACDAAPSDPVDGIDDPFVSGGKADGGLEDGTPLALGVLRVANEATFAELDDDVPLDVRAVRGIMAVREGPDGEVGTSDDGSFQTLVELDAVPYVGPIALERLTAYAVEHGFVSTSDEPSCEGFVHRAELHTHTPWDGLEIPAGSVDLRVEVVATDPALTAYFWPQISIQPADDPWAWPRDFEEAGTLEYDGLRAHVTKTATSFRLDLRGETSRPFRVDARGGYAPTSTEEFPFVFQVTDLEGRRCQVAAEPERCDGALRGLETWPSHLPFGPGRRVTIDIPAGSRDLRLEPAVVSPSATVTVEIVDASGHSVLPRHEILDSHGWGDRPRIVDHDGVTFASYRARGEGWGYGVEIIGETNQDYIARMDVDVYGSGGSATGRPWMLYSDEPARLCDQSAVSTGRQLGTGELTADASCNLDVHGERVVSFPCTLEEALDLAARRGSAVVLSTDVFGNRLQRDLGVYQLDDVLDFEQEAIFAYAGNHPAGTTATVAATMGSLWAPPRLRLVVEGPDPDTCPSRRFSFAAALPRPLGIEPQEDPRWVTQPSDIRDVEIVTRVVGECQE
jgi:hypothetical protein